jgi:hypothetical protein
MSTTPQRYSEPDETRSYMRRDGLGPWVRFTDHEADKARAVAEVRKDLDDANEQLDESHKRETELYWRKQYEEACIGWGKRHEEWESTIATQQATIARLTKELEALKPTP